MKTTSVPKTLDEILFLLHGGGTPPLSPSEREDLWSEFLREGRASYEAHLASLPKEEADRILAEDKETFLRSQKTALRLGLTLVPPEWIENESAKG